jgi:hypothetical protein
VPNYAIVRDQEVQITIPKAALQNGKNDIQVGKLTIKVPKTTQENPKSFAEVLSSGGLNDYIENLENVRIIVPPKIIKTITVNTIVIPGQDQDSSFTTIEVLTTDSDDKKVKITATEADEGKSNEQEKEGKNNFIFVFPNLAPNDEIKIGVYGGDNKDKLLQSEISKKLPKVKKPIMNCPKRIIAAPIVFIAY